jgi:DeoR/GlpR family transcriptional regulator of sugar metabolism
MKADERRAEIVQLLEKDGHAELGALSERFGVSTVTIHRDLEYLATQGRVERVRGGARPVNGTGVVNAHFAARLVNEADAKAEIASAAAALVPFGGTIFLDSSTTTLALSRALVTTTTPLTIVTNSPAVLMDSHPSNINVVVVPGELDECLKAITGRWAVEFIEHLSFTAAFVSCAGLSLERGLMTMQLGLADVNRAVFERSSHCYALADSSKFGVNALLSMGGLTELSGLVTDHRLGPDTRRTYIERGVPLYVADSDGAAVGVPEVSHEGGPP